MPPRLPSLGEPSLAARNPDPERPVSEDSGELGNGSVRAVWLAGEGRVVFTGVL